MFIPIRLEIHFNPEFINLVIELYSKIDYFIDKLTKVVDKLVKVVKYSYLVTWEHNFDFINYIYFIAIIMGFVNSTFSYFIRFVGLSMYFIHRSILVIDTFFNLN